MSTYACLVVGEPRERCAGLHPSSARRLRAFAVAIHIPVLIWIATSYLIGAEVFRLAPGPAIGLAAFCGLLIFLVERIILAAPKKWYVNAGRLFIGCVIAILGASAVDLVIFEREVAQQLLADGRAKIEAEYGAARAERQLAADGKKADWLAARAAATCEANGTCGSRVRSVGPIYRELSRHADQLRAEHLAAQARLEAIDVERAQALADWDSSPAALAGAGLLARIEALHRYTWANPAARIAWALFFLLVLFLELTVVLAKLVFGQTVDDELDQVREEISRHRALAYRAAVTSPVAGPRRLLEDAYG